MKIRTGFVSNSSSSSFIILLSRKPETAEEMHSWMFPEGPTSVNPYGEGYSSETIAKQAFNDLKNQEPMTLERMAEELDSGTVYAAGFPQYPSYKHDRSREEQERLWADYGAACKVAAEKLANKLKAQNPGKQGFRLEYSDNDGSFFTVMEHGDVFQALPHQQISHH